MKFSVQIAGPARRDLQDIAAYIAENDSVTMADHVLARIGDVLEGLATGPNRGRHPPELLGLTREEFREVFFKPYRIIYQVSGRTVNALVVADGRRNMRELLPRRLALP